MIPARGPQTKVILTIFVCSFAFAIAVASAIVIATAVAVSIAISIVIAWLAMANPGLQRQFYR